MSLVRSYTANKLLLVFIFLVGINHLTMSLSKEKHMQIIFIALGVSSNCGHMKAVL